ncbi:MFS general substrate transporter [Cylindrobasidium torrendii FP15055 ss-10]|uniref:MFS general substrate transporter n=1 Tax=Cylindrobasidium torrendii FP15055 ss-10 TaxID=1314674 RepID=A0A0D7BL43_9AGAR|nr:MFS general substrate transporter [Cylindrobasidium torrendii FP15055 ss-10]
MSNRSSFDDARTLRLDNAQELDQPQPGPSKIEIEEKSDRDPYQVDFDENDPANPQNWSNLRRWGLTVIAGILVLNATFASSAPSGIVTNILEEFHMEPIVATLMISLFVAGYCVGPLLWGPLSEEFGRRPLFIVSFAVYTCFQIGMALAKNTASLLVFRFIGGTFAAAPLTNSGALISDIWDARTRGKALAIFTVAPFAGPALGPTVAGFISVSGASWRWLFWVLTMFAGLCWITIILFVPETYKPILLVQKAKRLRKETGDDRYWAPMERTQKTLAQQVENILARPFKMLVLEPMLLSSTIYMSFIYGVLYLLFEAYPIIFTKGHGFNAGISGLMFLPIALGGVVAVILYLLIWNPRYERETARLGHAPPPEYRLHLTMFAAPLFSIACFWIGGASSPDVNYWAPLMAGGAMGFSISWLFLGFFNYIIDTYLMMAASALAANTVVRSAFGAAFPLFAGDMYEALNPHWASYLLGFVALAMVPLPFIFIKFGAKLRARSRFAPTKPVVPVEQTPTKESEKSEV